MYKGLWLFAYAVFEEWTYAFSAKLVRSSLLLTWINLIPKISNYAHYEVWDEITYPFLNYNGCTIDVWEWINKFVQHSILDVIIHSCWNKS